MGVELRPLGVNCNIACQYCYQNPQRDAGNVNQKYDLEKMKAAVEREGSSFILFGGEPLLVPEADLEELWSWGFEKFGKNGIQTNGTLINGNHIRMFKQYNVQVGISIDGPGELNDARWAGSLEKTREQTAKSEEAIVRLVRAGLTPSLIVTLHRGNASLEKLPIMHDWFQFLDSLCIRSVRLHVLEIDAHPVHGKYALSPRENLEAFLSFARLESDLRNIILDVFGDMENLLLATDGQATCVWQACDPYTTRAVQGIEGNGQRSNCGRTNKDGIDFVKTNQPGYERYLALYQTPQEYGGCKGCRFFLMCKGQCPGTAIDGDWRNRTADCRLWMELFEYVEKRLVKHGKQPISLDTNRHYLEAEMLRAWEAGMNPSLQEKLLEMKRVYEQQQADQRSPAGALALTFRMGTLQ